MQFTDGLLLFGRLNLSGIGFGGCGAGGGGCVALLIEPGARTRAETAIMAAGGTLLPLRIDRKGVRVKAV